ncbi:MAG: FecR family protein [Bacteroidota bacterium]
MTDFHDTEMVDLLAKYFAGEADADEASRILSWKDASPGNIAEFEKMQQLWTSADEVDWASAPSYNAEAAWENMQFRLDDSADISQKKFKIFSLKTLSRIAAILIITAVCGYVAWYMSTKPQDIIRIACSGENVEQTLSDSSVITLRNNSELSYSHAAFGVKDRKVTFRGTGYFKIAANKEKPFTIDLHGLNVKVVGTEFNIDSRADSDTATVSVIKGTVMMYDSLGHKAILTEGQQGLYSRKNAVLICRTNTDKNVAAWKTKTIIFERTEIREVVKVLEMVYGHKITVKKNQLNYCRITATFSNENLDNVIHIIAVTFNMNVKRDAENYILDGDGCQNN